MRRFLNRLILCYLACIATAPLCGRTTRSTTETAAAPSATVLSVRMVGESNDTVKGLQDLARDTTTYRPVLLADSLASSHTDSLLTAPVDTARLRAVTDSVSKLAAVPPIRPKFVPDPKRALWLSLILPGAGQIYNRKYWKLPILYGGFLGCAYALIWNQQMYRDYSQAYLDIMDDDPRTCSYLDMLPPRYDITGKEEQFKNVFKRKKDFYRRYRDLSAFCFVGVYILSVIDAYVDAQLSAFDITPDLSMRIAPTVLGSSPTFGSRSSTAYGVGCSLNF